MYCVLFKCNLLAKLVSEGIYCLIFYKLKLASQNAYKLINFD